MRWRAQAWRLKAQAMMAQAKAQATAQAMARAMARAMAKAMAQAMAQATAQATAEERAQATVQESWAPAGSQMRQHWPQRWRRRPHGPERLTAPVPEQVTEPQRHSRPGTWRMQGQSSWRWRQHLPRPQQRP